MGNITYVVISGGQIRLLMYNLHLSTAIKAGMSSISLLTIAVEELGRATTNPTRAGEWLEVEGPAISSGLVLVLLLTLAEAATVEGPGKERSGADEGPATGCSGAKLMWSGRLRACTGFFKSIFGLSLFHAKLA